MVRDEMQELFKAWLQHKNKTKATLGPETEAGSSTGNGIHLP